MKPKKSSGSERKKGKLQKRASQQGTSPKLKKESTKNKAIHQRALSSKNAKKSSGKRINSETDNSYKYSRNKNEKVEIKEHKNSKVKSKSNSDFFNVRDFSQDNFSHNNRNKQKKFLQKAAPVTNEERGLIRLNKYLANAGICSRREADKLIETGAVTVNGQVITELGYKVKPGDKVVYGGERIKAEKKVYILLNKPKGYITTTDDPQERKTVMDLIKGACKERVYPVGRLDRNTTGVLLLTNDGELTKKLLHPKHGIPKVYHVTLDKNVSKDDMQRLFEGIELEDGVTRVDNIAYASPLKNKKEVGVEIHSGKNRIVRRLFEHLGYNVIKLDRVSFAGLTKKDLSRGRYRFLTEKEVGFLKMIS